MNFHTLINTQKLCHDREIVYKPVNVIKHMKKNLLYLNKEN